MNRLIKFRGKVDGQWWYSTPDDDDYWEQLGIGRQGYGRAVHWAD